MSRMSSLSLRDEGSQLPVLATSLSQSWIYLFIYLTPGRIVLIQMRCFEWCPEDTAAAPNSPSPPVGLAAQPGPALRGDGGGGSARAGSGGGFVRGVPSPIQWGELQEGARDVQPAAPPHS